MKIKKTKGDYVFDVCNTLLLLIIAVIMLVPLLHVVSVSFSDGKEVLKGGLFLYPHGWNLKGYEYVFTDPSIGTSYLNTVLYTVSHTVLSLFFTALTAYPLSIHDFVLKKFITVFLAITMFFSGGLIPSYLLITRLHLMNSRLVMIVVGVVGAYNVILFRTFFSGIDSGLRESAMLDGAGEFTILFRIIFPVSKAIFATVGLFTIVGKWNDWFSAMLYLSDESKYPLQMILRKILFNAQTFATVGNSNNIDPITRLLLMDGSLTPANIQMATIVVIMLPILCIYPFVQKYFAKGVMVGSIKG